MPRPSAPALSAPAADTERPLELRICVLATSNLGQCSVCVCVCLCDHVMITITIHIAMMMILSSPIGHIVRSCCHRRTSYFVGSHSTNERHTSLCYARLHVSRCVSMCHLSCPPGFRRSCSWACRSSKVPAQRPSALVRGGINRNGSRTKRWRDDNVAWVSITRSRRQCRIPSNESADLIGSS